MPVLQYGVRKLYKRKQRGTFFNDHIEGEGKIKRLEDIQPLHFLASKNLTLPKHCWFC